MLGHWKEQILEVLKAETERMEKKSLYINLEHTFTEDIYIYMYISQTITDSKNIPPSLHH